MASTISLARDEAWAQTIEDEWDASGIKRYAEKKVIYSSDESSDDLHGVFIQGIPGQAGITIYHTAAGPRDLFLHFTAARLVNCGYSVFIADLYGDEYGQGWQSEFSSKKREELKDIKILRKRSAAALDTFQKYLPADVPIAAIGYCLGGRAVAELAKAGENRLQALVSFHGILDDFTPVECTDSNSLAWVRMLILHGDQDPFVPHLDAFRNQMHRHGAAVCDLVSFSGAYHGFTNPGQALNEKIGFDYNRRAAALAWHLCEHHLSTYLS
eukprot:CAMPEP_0197289796 /NCGR_PEP_ID=MMETSP0890-20130614/7065_1 /TAXON_ID=44058 ORGANISM="Aureoumbra lagunensis, Strain CCMP1510" /NCGR_SAMPLE_ID=MMETSP0890 /ASSEMBLY_ACC=CAM_ASM_000533 /LENGTH=269 /DNA_ID=CAMNT_0042761429 /DNA_START=279 /DNA_END=1088 /DNA_ORIENTATION=+